MRQLYFMALAIGVFASIGCEKPEKVAPKPAPTAPEAPASDRHEGGLAWIADDYPAALAAAKASGRPLVIDLWAPWCHTCLSMKTIVLDSSALASLGDRFVWLAIDTDKPTNADVLSKFPPQAWPTFYVVSPGDESIQARHVGAASVEQFRELLTQGENGHLDASAAAGATIPPELALVREGDRAVATERYDDATIAYERALATAPPQWDRSNEVQLMLVSALNQAKANQKCVDIVRRELVRVSANADASAADFAFIGLDCAKALGSDAHAALAAEVTRDDGPLVSLHRRGQHKLSADDESELLRLLRTAAIAAGDLPAAERWAQLQLQILDQAAANAPNAFAKMTYNWPRAEVYVYLGRGAELIEELRASAQDLPDQYDPPYRLAWVQLMTGDYDDALESAEAALSRAYGPRKGRVYSLLAAIHHSRNDDEQELAMRRAELVHYQGLAPGHRRDKDIARAQQALDAMKR